MEVEQLNSADQLDACLAALTGLRALQGEASWVGVPGETVLALPIAKLPERAYPRDGAAPPAPRPVTWAAFEEQAPDFAARARAMLAARKHLTMATLRKDGGPRISGTEIQFRAGELVVGSMPRSVKGADLLRDARVAIHGPTTDPPDGAPAAWPGEAKVAGLAHRLPDEAEALFFAIRVHEVVVTHLNQAGDRLVVESWTAERGYRSFERE